MNDGHQEILCAIERYLEKSGMTPTAFGKSALRDPKFVFELRKGRECRSSTLRRITEFMSSNPPASGSGFRTNQSN